MRATHQPVKLITKINFRYFPEPFIPQYTPNWFLLENGKPNYYFYYYKGVQGGAVVSAEVARQCFLPKKRKKKKEKKKAFYSQFCHLLERWKSLWKGDKAQEKSWQETGWGRRGMWQNCETHNMRRLYLFLDGQGWSSVKAVHFQERCTAPFIQKDQQCPYREIALIMPILEIGEKRLRTRPNVQSVFLQTSKLWISP